MGRKESDPTEHSSHIGDPLRMSPLSHRLFILYLLLKNGSCWQVGACSLITLIIIILSLTMFIITITASLSAMLGSSRPQGSCSNAIYVALGLQSVCTLHAGVAFQRALSMFAFRTVRKIHPMVPAAVCSANGNSLPPFQCYRVTCSQSSTGAQAKRISVTGYHMLSGGPWLPPSSGASGSPTCWESCRLCQLDC